MVPFQYVLDTKALLSGELHDMAVGIAGEQRARVSQPSLGERDHSRRDERRMHRTQRRGRTARIGGKQRGLPMDQVVRPLIGREGPAIVRREILEQLDAGTRSAAESRDAQASAEDVVEMLLLRTQFSLVPATRRPSASR